VAYKAGCNYIIRVLVFFLAALCAVIGLSACATIPPVRKPPSYPTKEICPVLPGVVLRQDIYHTVGPGETLWRISKMYDVKIEEVIRANGLGKPEELKMGQRLIIPQAAPLRPVIPLYRSDRWEYIIIHHSATDQGDALSLNKIHLNRGFWKGLGYNFTIDNGTCGKADGQIEVSPRWIKQEEGAHCRAFNMNHVGIGICLVGNFSIEKVSGAQMDSLVYLVDALREYYNIPLANIKGHGQVPGAKTECPGIYFPWDEFRVRLKKN